MWVTCRHVRRDNTYRIKSEELSFLAVEKAEAEGRGLFHSLEWRAPRVLTDLKHIRP